MKFEFYNPIDEKGGCIPRAISKFFNTDYNQVKQDLIKLVTKLGYDDYRQIEVFENYLQEKGLKKIKYQSEEIKDLDYSNGSYLIFAHKNDFYHLTCIINNIIYDKNNNIEDLEIISIYKM